MTSLAALAWQLCHGSSARRPSRPPPSAKQLTPPWQCAQTGNISVTFVGKQENSPTLDNIVRSKFPSLPFRSVMYFVTTWYR